MKKLPAKFLEVMKECSHVAKNGSNSFHGYKYATSADVLEKVNASLVKHGIATMVVPELVSLTDVTTAKGNVEHLATVKVEVTLVDVDSEEVMVISGIGGGQDSGDKAAMKAQTAAIKYAYLLSLAISTGDAPEADQRTDENSAGVTATQPARRAPAGAAAAGGTCALCGAKISAKVKQFSERRYGQSLCMDCQKTAQASA